MTITREWLLSIRTHKGGWTKAQLAALGISWPPPKGWQQTLIGREISNETGAEATRCVTVYADTKTT